MRKRTEEKKRAFSLYSNMQTKFAKTNKKEEKSNWLQTMSQKNLCQTFSGFVENNRPKGASAFEKHTPTVQQK